MDVNCSSSYHHCRSSCLHSLQEEMLAELMVEGITALHPCRAIRLPMETAQLHGLVSTVIRVLPSRQRRLLHAITGALPVWPQLVQYGWPCSLL